MNDHKNKDSYLHAVNSQAGTSVQLLVANVAFKMLCLLMLNEDFFIVKVSIAIPSAVVKVHNKFSISQNLT